MERKIETGGRVGGREGGREALSSWHFGSRRPSVTLLEEEKAI